jgi:3-dehydrosphinganine reductase
MKAPHALVTGGSSGIGLAVARRLLADGFNLSLVARGEERLRRARELLLADTPGREVVTVAADVSDRARAEGAVHGAAAALGPPRMVVTCAGVAHPGYFEQVDASVFERTMAVNYLGTVYVVKAALPLMERPGGRIVMISSGAGLIGIFGYTAYSPTKFALRGFAEALHAELRHQGVGVSIAFPPDTDTPQLAEEMKTKPPETVLMTGTVKAWSAEQVAERIVRESARGTFAVTPGLALTLLYRGGSLLSPLVQRFWSWKLRRKRRGGMAA